VAKDEAFIWDTPTPRVSRRGPAAKPPDVSGRIPLREAEERFGVRASTLRTWARKGTIDGIQSGGSRGDQWMVTPESIAHHLSRRKPQVTTPPTRAAAADRSSMLVPRDAWDKLMDQLGNLHEAGLQLAEARERAAKAETEAVFLRERLAEIRAERDDLKSSPTEPVPVPRTTSRWWRWRRKDASSSE
jgi:DNA-binding transcriptional MerR regulator